MMIALPMKVYAIPTYLNEYWMNEYFFLACEIEERLYMLETNYIYTMLKVEVNKYSNPHYVAPRCIAHSDIWLFFRVFKLCLNCTCKKRHQWFIFLIPIFFRIIRTVTATNISCKLSRFKFQTHILKTIYIYIPGCLYYLKTTQPITVKF